MKIETIYKTIIVILLIACLVLFKLHTIEQGKLSCASYGEDVVGSAYDVKTKKLILLCD